MSAPSNTVWTAPAVQTWLVALERLDAADGPLTAYTATKREGRAADQGRRCLEALERYGLVERVLNARYPRWRITAKGRTYLEEGVREMSEWLRGDW
jgi:ribosomal protein S19E (S16A)